MKGGSLDRFGGVIIGGVKSNRRGCFCMLVAETEGFGFFVRKDRPRFLDRFFGVKSNSRGCFCMLYVARGMLVTSCGNREERVFCLFLRKRSAEIS